MKLGEHLVAAGVIDHGQLDAGLAHAARTGTRLGAALIALGHANGDQVATALGKQHRVAAARDKHLATASTSLAARLDATIARAHHAVIVGEGRDRELVIAMHNPLDADAIEQLEKATGRVVVAAVASVVRLDEAIARLYPVGGSNIHAAAAAAAEAFTAPPPRAKAASSPRIARSTPTIDLGPPKRPSHPGPLGTATELPAAPRAPMPALDLDAPAPRDAEGGASVPMSRRFGVPAEAPGASAESIGLAMGSAPEMTPLPPVVPPENAGAQGQTPRPRSKTQTIPPTRRMQQLAGGTSLRSSPARRGVSPILKIGLGLAVTAAVAVFTYRQCSSAASWSVKSDYTSTYLRAHLPLPGTGWRGHPSLQQERRNGDAWGRVEGVYRGGDVEDPDEGLLLMRVHAPGQFPDEVDMEAFRRQLDQLARNITQSASGLATASLECTIDSRVRSEPAGRCRGTGTFKGQMINFYMFYWEDSVDDVFAVIYISKGRIEDQVPPLEAFIHEIQVQ